MSKFDETLTFIAEIERATTPDAVCQQLLTVSAQFGLNKLVAGTLPPLGTPIHEFQARHVLLNGWPQGWITRYGELNYVYIDPIVHRIQSDVSPFNWEQALVGDLPSATRKMLSEAGEFGLKVGLAIPLSTLEGETAAISLGGERMDLSPHARGMLSLMSTYALGRAIQLRNAPVKVTHRALTMRETEAMRWAADGKTEWEISVIMSISEHTAAKHLNNARGKLGAVNRVQAIANAIRSGVIR